VSGWEFAFERDKHKVARAVHEAWAAEKIKQGFADHVLREVKKYDDGAVGTLRYHRCRDCDLPAEKHHPDMLDYDDLSPEVQEYDIVTARIVYPLAFQAGQFDYQDRYLKACCAPETIS